MSDANELRERLDQVVAPYDCVRHNHMPGIIAHGAWIVMALVLILWWFL